MSTDSAAAAENTSGVGTVANLPLQTALPERRLHLPVPRKRAGVASVLLVADCLVAALVCWMLYGVESSVVYAAGPLLLAQVVMHAYRGAYQVRLCHSALSDVPVLAECSLLVWCTLAALLAAWHTDFVLSWQALLVAVGGQVVLLTAARALVYAARARLVTRQPRPTLVIGRGGDAYQLAGLLLQEPALGLRPVGLVTGHRIPPPAAEGRVPALPVLHDGDDMVRALIQNGVQHAVVASTGGSALPAAPDVMEALRRHHLRVWVVDLGEDEHPWLSSSPGRDHVYGYPARAAEPGPVRSPGLLAKRLVDITLAAAALLVLSPVLAACALAVRWADGPGVLFRQERIGLDGRAFTVLKFRSLKPTDKAESDTRWNVAGDARLSRVGDFLRRSSLDELPQLWNVLRGDMSLVGPRPERPFFVEQFSQKHPGYAARHRMPVGITGLAQVHGLRGDTSIPDRARFDNRYIGTWSLWQDVCVILRTAASLLRPGGG